MWLVELAALSDPALVSQAVADMPGMTEQAVPTLSPALLGALRASRPLLWLSMLSRSALLRGLGGYVAFFFHFLLLLRRHRSSLNGLLLRCRIVRRIVAAS